MLKRAAFPGKYLQGAGAIAELPHVARALGGRALMLASPTARRRVLPAAGIDAPDIVVEEFGGECCEEELARVAGLIGTQGAEVVIALGGGKTIDTAKIAADRAHLPAIVVPTIASTDAPCSGCAVIYSKAGVFECVAYQRLNPAAVLVDLSIIANAPTRFLVAGMGDALATWFEARSCERTGSPNECGGIATAAGLQLARLCYDTLLEHGIAAKVANDAHVVTPALDRIVEANTLLSGLGFESGGLASAHAIHNGLTALHETHAFYHGEKVAFGVLTGLQLTGAAPAETDTVFGFCEDVGLPTTLAAIGLEHVSRERLREAAARACAADQPIHHEACEVTADRVLDAMVATDAIGRARGGRA